MECSLPQSPALSHSALWRVSETSPNKTQRQSVESEESVRCTVDILHLKYESPEYVAFRWLHTCHLYVQHVYSSCHLSEGHFTVLTTKQAHLVRLTWNHSHRLASVWPDKVRLMSTVPSRSPPCLRLGPDSRSAYILTSLPPRPGADLSVREGCIVLTFSAHLDSPGCFYWRIMMLRAPFRASIYFGTDFPVAPPTQPHGLH